MTLADRLNEAIKNRGVTAYRIEQDINISRVLIGKYLKGTEPSVNNILLLANYLDVSLDWLVRGEENSKVEATKEADTKENDILDTRPRIPLNAAAGSVSVALSGVTLEDTEKLPFIHAFSNYNYTILVKGDSMLPEFHSGDELACLQLNGKASFIQWGRYHVLDTAQGVVVKRIYDNGEYVLCKSENNELYPDFKIHKEDIYNIGLVIGMLRRY